MLLLLKNWLIKNTNYVYIAVFIIAIIVRIFGIFTPAHPYDIGTFESWAAHMNNVGPKDFYSTTWSDYLPLPLYGLVPVIWFATHFNLSFALAFKAITTILELSIIGLITICWSNKNKLILFTLLMFSPAIIGDTSFWGQIDTIPALLILLSFVLVLRSSPSFKHYFNSAFLFGIAVAIKPIVLLVAPILWALSIKDKFWWTLPIIGPILLFATGYPMAGIHAPRLLWERATEQAGTYPYTTINAWNIWSIVSKSSSWLTDSTMVLGLSAHTAGILMFIILFFILLITWKKSGWKRIDSLKIAAIILITFFSFTTRMHERHLLFGLPLLSAAAALYPWLLIPLGLLTFNFTLNLFSAYSWVIHSQAWPFASWVTTSVSWITTLSATLLVFVWNWPRSLASLLRSIKGHKIMFALLILASSLRLVNLSFPTDYIFDEVYHGFTAREYLHNRIEAWEWWTTPPEGVAYEWTHPPVAKYGMVVGMLLFGENSFGWRVGSAVFGVLSILGIYLLCRALNLSINTSLIATSLVTIEGLHISQSRLAMNDVYMLNFYIWSLYYAVKSRWKAAAILYGLALASKWSSLYGLIPLMVIYLNQNPIKLKISYFIFHALYAVRLILISLLVYTITFAPFILAGHTWEQWIELHRQMWYYHTHLVATHDYQSTPLQWIFDVRPVWYYVKYQGDTTSNIYALGNPFILWLGLVAALIQIRQIFTYPYSILYILYIIFTLPWVFSPRIMFFYHYLPGSVFLCIILATLLRSMSKRSIIILLSLGVASMILISPMIFGIPITSSYWNALFNIFPSWK